MAEINGGGGSAGSGSGGGGIAIPKALPLRPRRTAEDMDKKLREASAMYEKLFMNEMMKAMRSTVHEGGLIKQNSAEKLFRDELDQEYVNKWSEKGGLGFSEIIYNSMIEKFGVQMGLKAPVDKPKGPLPLNEKSNFNGVTRTSPPAAKELTYRFDRNEVKTPADAESAASATLTEVHAPWSGLLTGKKDLADGSQLLEISHDNGLQGQLVFRGSSERLKLGQQLQEGEKIGLLSPEAKSFFWTLAPREPSVSE